MEALTEEEILPGTIFPSDANHLDWTPMLAQAVHVYLARTPSFLLMVQLDDLADEENQANLPGSTTQYPNWRRRLSRALADLLTDPAIRKQTEAINAERRCGGAGARLGP